MAGSLNVLVLCDDYWHPARIPRAGLKPLERYGFAFDWIENAHDWSPERMSAYPVVVLTKSNNVSSSDRRPWVTPEVEAAFRDYVRNGNGLLAIHSGSADYDRLPVLRRLLGGVFKSHPPQCSVTIEPQDGHTIASTASGTVGVEGTQSNRQMLSPFTVFDEHYFMDFDDKAASLILTTSSEHGKQPGGWTRYEGNGRVCVLTPGHNLDVWLHPSYQVLLRNALRWCSKVTDSGVVST